MILFPERHIRILLFRSRHTVPNSCWYRTVPYKTDLPGHRYVCAYQTNMREEDTVLPFLPRTFRRPFAVSPGYDGTDTSCISPPADHSARPCCSLGGQEHRYCGGCIPQDLPQVPFRYRMRDCRIRLQIRSVPTVRNIPPVSLRVPQIHP